MLNLTALGIDVYGFDAEVKCMVGINGDVADRREALVLRIRGTLSP